MAVAGKKRNQVSPDFWDELGFFVLREETVIKVKKTITLFTALILIIKLGSYVLVEVKS